MSETDPLESILDEADNVAEKGGSADLRSLIEAFDDRAFGPVLVLLGLLALSPFGAIPGIPVALAIVITLFAAQILCGRNSPWLPNFIADIEIGEDKISNFQENAGKWLSRVDGLLKPRLEWATGAIARRLAAALSILLSLTMIPLEAIPFAVAIPAAGITLFGVGLTARDGLAMILAFFASFAAAVGFWWLL